MCYCTRCGKDCRILWCGVCPACYLAKPRSERRIPLSLRRKQRQAIRRAKQYRKEHGNPADNLAQLLDQLVEDEETWRAIVDEPYG